MRKHDDVSAQQEKSDLPHQGVSNHRTVDEANEAAGTEGRPEIELVVDADHEGDDCQHAQQHHEKETWPDHAAGIGQQRKQEGQDERALGHQLADRGRDGDQRRQPRKRQNVEEQCRPHRQWAAQQRMRLGPSATARFAVSASVLIERWAPETQAERRGRTGATSSGRKTSRTWRNVMTRATPFLPLGRQRAGTQDKSARLNSDPRDPQLTETV